MIRVGQPIETAGVTTLAQRETLIERVRTEIQQLLRQNEIANCRLQTAD
jgi:hypothetical protein